MKGDFSDSFDAKHKQYQQCTPLIKPTNGYYYNPMSTISLLALALAART
jgi:hypothetical protein